MKYFFLFKIWKLEHNLNLHLLSPLERGGHNSQVFTKWSACHSLYFCTGSNVRGITRHILQHPFESLSPVLSKVTVDDHSAAASEQYGLDSIAKNKFISRNVSWLYYDKIYFQIPHPSRLHPVAELRRQPSVVRQGHRGWEKHGRAATHLPQHQQHTQTLVCYWKQSGPKSVWRQDSGPWLCCQNVTTRHTTSSLPHSKNCKRKNCKTNKSFTMNIYNVSLTQHLPWLHQVTLTPSSSALIQQLPMVTPSYNVPLTQNVGCNCSFRQLQLHVNHSITYNL